MPERLVEYVGPIKISIDGPEVVVRLSKKQARNLADGKGFGGGEQIRADVAFSKVLNQYLDMCGVSKNG